MLTPTRALLAGVLLLVTTCVTPDRDRMVLGVSRGAIHENSATGMESDLKGDPTVRGRATIFMPRKKGGWSSFLLGLSVDSQESALHHFQSRFLGVYLKLKNESNIPIDFRSSALVLKTEHQDIASIDPGELPEAFTRLNWKGNLKNAYNATVMAAGTVAIVAGVLFCLKEDECDFLIRSTHSAVRLTAGYMEKERRGEIFSNVSHDTKLIYENLLPQQAYIPPGGSVEGLVFFPRPAKFSVARVFWRKDGVRDDDL